MVNRETEHYQEWKSANESDLIAEFVAKVTPPVLDDDMSDYIDENYDDFMEYVDQQYGNADHDIYPSRGSC